MCLLVLCEKYVNVSININNNKNNICDLVAWLRKFVVSKVVFMSVCGFAEIASKAWMARRILRVWIIADASSAWEPARYICWKQSSFAGILLCGKMADLDLDETYQAKVCAAKCGSTRTSPLAALLWFTIIASLLPYGYSTCTSVKMSAYADWVSCFDVTKTTIMRMLAELSPRPSTTVGYVCSSEAERKKGGELKKIIRPTVYYPSRESNSGLKLGRLTS